MSASAPSRVREFLGILHEVDLALFRKAAESHVSIADATLPVLSRAADRSILWIGIAGGLWLTRRRFARRAALRGLTSLGMTSALVNLPVKWTFRRRRPRINVVPKARRLLRLPTSRSFPSGHSASAFAFATGASIELPALAPIMGPLAAAVASSRVYVGVHYPGDVLAGAAIGTAMGVASLRMWPRASHRPPHVKPTGSLADHASTGKGLVLAINRDAGSMVSNPSGESLSEALPDARIIEVAIDDGDELRHALDAQVDDATVIGVAGGDGSVNCVAQIAVDAGKPLLVVPAGTLNHLARDLGIDDVASALDAARGGRTAAVDVATIDGQVFLNTASFGSYVELVDMREQFESRLGKWPAVVLALMIVLRRSRPLELELDGHNARVWMGFIGNCRYEPTGFAPSWRERLDDGYLDVRIVDASKRCSRLRLLGSILTGRVGSSRVYQQKLVRALTIRSPDGPLRLARDGETFKASAGEFTVEKHPTRLTVLVPEDRPIPS